MIYDDDVYSEEKFADMVLAYEETNQFTLAMYRLYAQFLNIFFVSSRHFDGELVKLDPSSRHS